MNIAYLGIGEMGAGMAGNILEKNGSLTIWNRTKDKPAVAELISRGAHFEESINDAVRDADFVCSCLYSGPSALEVAQKAVSAMKRGAIFTDFTTLAPLVAEQLHEQYAKAGVSYLDSPVSGGVTGANAGTLSIMVGGDAAAYERALPIYNMCGVTILRMGEVGLGQKTKLINQLMSWVNQAVVCEGMALAERAGIDLQALYDVLKVSYGQSRMLDRSVEDYIIPRDFGRPAKASLVLKDMNLVKQMASDLNCDIPITTEAVRAYDFAVDAGLGEKDASVLIEVMEKRNFK